MFAVRRRTLLATQSAMERATFRANVVAAQCSFQTRGATVAVIADASTHNGKALPGVLSKLQGSADWLIANDLETFEAWPRISDVDVVVPVGFASGKPELIRELWPLCPKIRWVHSMSTGVESIVPMLNALPRGPETELTNAKGAFSSSLAEYAIMAMLHFNKQVPRLQANRSGRVWEKFVMPELRDLTVGFVGFGDIAKATATLCKAFGMNILALRNSPSASAKGLADEVFYGADGTLEVFRRSDFVICTLPGGDATKHFCGEKEFASMKPTGVFISMGRGTAVDEASLVATLQDGRILGAALDVFETEPLPLNSPLWSCENLLLSSHNADLTANYMDLSCAVFLQRFAEYAAPGFKAFEATVDKVKGY